MKIITAKTAGFCMGVHRVVNLAVEITSTKSDDIFSLGPLIHNNQTLEMLQERGVNLIDENKPPKDNSTILIRAHGVPPETQKEFTNKNYNLIDGTCPKVKTVHKVIQKYRKNGFSIIITGDEGHAEVIGLLGYAGDGGYLVQNTKDIDNLPPIEKICIVSQTTFNRDTFDEITEKINKKFPHSEIVVRKTICAATDKRQKETRELAQLVDAMIVVGGKNSANTLRLAKISRESNTITQHIETEQEIDWKSISKCKTVGISAGASTPSWMIKRVADHLHFLARANKNTITGKISQLFDILANINFFVALGGVAMYYASCAFQEIPFRISGAALSFLYLMSIYLWNSLTCVEKNMHLDISRYRFYSAHKIMLTGLALSCIAILLGISLLQNVHLFYLMLIPTIAGLVYQFSIIPQTFIAIFKYRNLKDIPTSRDLFAAMAWAVLITFIPQAIEKTFFIKASTIAFFLWTFFLAFIRSLVFDLKDIEGDRIMGRETLITIIGESKVKYFINFALFASCASFLIFSGLTYIPHYRLNNVPAYAFLLQIPVLIYLWMFMKWQHLLKNHLSALFNILANGQFYIAGFAAWIVAFISR